MTFLWFNNGDYAGISRASVIKRETISPLDGVAAKAAVSSKVIDKNEPRLPLEKENKQAINQYEDAKDAPEERTFLSASAIMSTNMITASPSDSIHHVRYLMEQHRFRHIPIVSGDNKVQGIISDREIFKFYTAQYEAQQYTAAKQPISTIMKPKVLVTTSDTHIREVSNCMFENHVGCMPIINDKHELIGIITRSDILRAINQRLNLNTWV